MPDRESTPTSLTISLGKNLGEYTFTSFDDIKEFIENEGREWDWCLGLKLSSYRFGSSVFTNTINFALKHLSGIAHYWENGSEELEELVESYGEFVDNVNIPFSITPVGRYILDVANRSDVTAIYMLHLHCVPSCNPNTLYETSYEKEYSAIIPYNDHRVMGIHNANEGYRFEANRLLVECKILSSDESIKSLVGSLESGTSRIGKVEEKSKHEFTELIHWIEDQKKDIENDTLETTKKYLRRARAVYRKILRRETAEARKAEEVLASSESELKAAKDAFSAQVEFSETVNYWSEKETKHDTSKVGWAIGVCVALVCILILPILVSLIPNTEFAGTDLIFGAYHPTKLIMTLLVVSVSSYVLRFCSRQFSTQQHLYLEAIERQTMIKTYIGLMMNNKLSEFEDRKIALDTLFRPAQTGIVEDHGSVVASDSIIRIVEKQTGAARASS